ncbi:MAG: sensor histidine kinase [Akkermansiaceae bacterium]
MKLHFPLYARIAGWFSLNILLIVLIVLLFSQQYFNLQTLVSGPAGERLNTLAINAGEIIKTSDEDAQQSALQQLGEKYKLSFLALGPQSEILIGEKDEIPSEILLLLEEKKRPPSPNLPNRPQDVPQHRGSSQLGPPPHGNRPPPEHFFESDSPNSFSDNAVTAQPIFASKDLSGEYWFGYHLELGRLNNVERSRAPMQSTPPLLLLIRSPSLSANGLLLDYKPWIRLGATILILSILLWIPFAWKLSRYIKMLTLRTIAISRGNFDVAEIKYRGDELGHLGSTINKLRQQLRGYVNGQKRFTSDIAHELCSPLARMQLSLGVIEQQNTVSPETLDDLCDEVQQMSSMVNELLDFSRASINPDKVILEVVDLALLVEEVVQKEGAAEVKIGIKANTLAKANPHLLKRALGNVIRNAMKYAPAKPINISTATMSDSIEILVDDEGPGIQEKHLSRIFEPFYRVDNARMRESGGSGLGLAIVNTCMEGSGGSASCENLTKGGLRVILSLRRVQTTI